MTALAPPTLTKEDVQALAAEAAAKDLSAFDALHAHYATHIHNHIRRMMRTDDQDAADLTQDAFLKAWLGLITGKFDGRRFEGWLFRIATNVCLDELRHRAHIAFDHLDDLLAAPMTRKRAALFVSHDPLDDPVRVVEREETAGDVRATVERIGSPNQQRAVRLREFGDLTYDEIAEVMDTTRAAVKSLLFHAREGIRRTVSPEVFA